MALNIDLVNGGINVYETGEAPRTYFGSIGASGKIYPSGTSGQLLAENFSFEIFLDNTSSLGDGGYNDIPSSSNGSGTPSALFNIDVNGGVVDGVPQCSNYLDTMGFAIGDLVTIQGSDLGGSGELILKVTQVVIDGILFVVGGDNYQIKWNDLLINGTSPTSLDDTTTLLSNLLIGVTGQPYKVYTAIISQTGGNAPTATVLQNTIHPDLTWGYNASGRYGISTGGTNVFTASKTITTQGSLVNNTGAIIGSIYGERDDDTVYKIYTWDNNIGDYYDGLLTNYTIEIRVYN